MTQRPIRLAGVLGSPAAVCQKRLQILATMTFDATSEITDIKDAIARLGVNS